MGEADGEGGYDFSLSGQKGIASPSWGRGEGEGEELIRI